jgi:recombinational DNA repair protein RecR
MNEHKDDLKEVKFDMMPCSECCRVGRRGSCAVENEKRRMTHALRDLHPTLNQGKSSH